MCANFFLPIPCTRCNSATDLNGVFFRNAIILSAIAGPMFGKFFSVSEEAVFKSTLCNSGSVFFWSGLSAENTASVSLFGITPQPASAIAAVRDVKTLSIAEKS